MRSGRKPESSERADDAVEDDAVTHSILDAIRGVKFGSVEIIIHDARVVQILRTEKLRLDR